ncbi:MAG: ATP-dependent DNA ligase [Casimicrobiaceae bacterium]
MLAAVAATSEQVAATSSRRAKAAAIAALLGSLAPDETAIVVAYLAGELPQGRIGIGWAALREARTANAAGSPTLAIAEVNATLEAIAATSGPGSAAQRNRRLAGLLERATAAEQDFLTRLLQGELRQGSLEGVMIEGVAAAAGLCPADVRRAAMVAGGIARVAASVLADGDVGLARFVITPFQPVAPMLAQPADDIVSALEASGPAALEWKMDGARVQVHRRGNTVRLFTRSLNDVTAAAPEVVAVVAQLPDDDLILDGEIIALGDDGTPRPFQVTMSRFGRTLDVANQSRTLPLSVFFFDCLRRGGVDLTGADTETRYAALVEAVGPVLRMPRHVTDDPATAQAFFEEAIGRGHEGVMVKALGAPYQPGTRSASWRKVKRAHTLDLVVLAAEWGHGRRHRWLSNLHLGARDHTTGEFVMLGKTFKGLTDTMLAWQTDALLARATASDTSIVHVRPEIVVEVTFNELQASTRYPGGLALRFARVKAFRPDKRPEDTDTIETVRAIFRAQGSDRAVAQRRQPRGTDL